MEEHCHNDIVWLLYPIVPSGTPTNPPTLLINSTSVHLSWLPPDEDQLNGGGIRHCSIRHCSIRIVQVHSGRVFQLNYTGSTVAADTVELGPYTDPAIATVPEDGMHTPVML